jgi:hypothetical protein
VRPASLVAILVVASGAAVVERDRLGALAGPAALAAAALTAAAALLGLAIARLARANRAGSVALSICFSTRSVAVAAVVGAAVLDAPLLLACLVVMFAVHTALASLAVVVLRACGPG